MKNNIKHIFIIYLSLYSVFIHGQESDTSIFVSTSSKSMHPDGSFTKPFSSIQQAVDSVASSGNKGKHSILLRAGTYRIDKPIILKPNRNSPDLFIRPYLDENVIISGGKNVTEWKSTLNDNIFYSNIDTHTFRQLYVDKSLAILARYPNINNRNTFGPYFKTNSINRNKREFHLSRKIPNNLECQDKDRYEIVLIAHWVQQIIYPVTSEENEFGNFVVQPKDAEKHFMFNKPEDFFSDSYYHFQNSFCFLDVQNEWFYDPEDNSLYYYSEDQDIRQLSIEYPISDSIFIIQGDGDSGKSKIVIENLILENTNWNYPSDSGISFTQFSQPYEVKQRKFVNRNYPSSVIKINNTPNVIIQGNTIRNSGGTAIQVFSNCDNLLIRANHIYNTAANGIEIDSISKKRPDSSISSNNVVISDNVIHDVGRSYSNGGAILAHYVSNMEISHNHIFNTPYSGIQIGGQPLEYEFTGTYGNTVIANHLHNVMQLHDDGGAIYTLGGVQRGTYISNNYIHDIHRSYWAGQWYVDAIYLDNYSQYIIVADNLVVDANLGGEHNKSKDNYFINNNQLSKSLRLLKGKVGPRSKVN